MPIKEPSHSMFSVTMTDFPVLTQLLSTRSIPAKSLRYANVISQCTVVH